MFDTQLTFEIDDFDVSDDNNNVNVKITNLFFLVNDKYVKDIFFNYIAITTSQDIITIFISNVIANTFSFILNFANVKLSIISSRSSIFFIFCIRQI